MNEQVRMALVLAVLAAILLCFAGCVGAGAALVVGLSAKAGAIGGISVGLVTLIIAFFLVWEFTS